MPPVFLAPALQPFLRLTSSNPASRTSHHYPQHQHRHPFSTTAQPQSRLRNREKNKSRGVSAIRRTGPRVPLSMSKYPLPEPVWDPASRKEFKTRDDHGLWGFFNEQRMPMTAPEDLDAHGRAWTTAELARKNWDDLWIIWWRCVRERNYLATEAHERKRVEAGYGEAESKERVVEVSYHHFTYFFPWLEGRGASCLWGVRFARERKSAQMMRNSFPFSLADMSLAGQDSA